MNLTLSKKLFDYVYDFPEELTLKFMTWKFGSLEHERCALADH